MRHRTRLVFLAIFILVISASIALFWVVTERLGSTAAENQVDEILDTTEQTAVSMVTNSFDNVDRATAAVTQLASQTEIAGPGSAFGEWAMFQALEFVPELSGVFIANSAGDFHFVFRTEEGFTTKRIQTLSGEREVWFAEHDDQFAQTATWRDTEDTYNPRTRLWYSAAMASPGEAIWTDPYLFFTSQQPGITRAISSADPSLDWVVGVDVQLVSFVDLLEELSVRISGEVFLFDGDATALTRAGLVDLNAEVGETDLRVRSALEAGADNGTDAEAQGSVHDAGAEDDDGNDRIEYDIDGVAHTVRFTPLPLGDGSWSLVTDISDADVAVPVSGLIRALRFIALAISGLAAVAMALLMMPATKQIERLEQDATIDPLTLLPNRRAILRIGEAVDARFGDYSVAMVDVDKFKRVNDEHGHFIGDEVLQELAQRLTGDGREVGRLGGEEFVVLLQAGSGEANLLVADEIRHSIGSEPIVTTAGPLDLTISVGVAAHEDGEVFTAVLKRADEALLAAKLDGRNRVVSAQSVFS